MYGRKAVRAYKSRHMRAYKSRPYITMLQLHHWERIVPIIADQFWTFSCQDRDQPWRLPADNPNGLHLVNRCILPWPGPCATIQNDVSTRKYTITLIKIKCLIS